MARATQESIEDWLQELPWNEVDLHMSFLEMKRQPGHFANLHNLSRWILGEYTPENFLEADEPGDVIARHKDRRERFIKEVLDMDHSEHPDQNEEHPLAAVLRDQVVAQNLAKTTSSHLPVVNPGRNTENEEEETEPRLAIHGNKQQRKPTAQQQSEEMLNLISANGTEFQVPRDISLLLTELITKVKSLEYKISSMENQAAASTHIYDDRPGHVQFADTFTVHERSDEESATQAPTPVRSQQQADLRGVNPAWVGGDRPTGRPNWSVPSGFDATNNFSRSGFGHSRDVGQIVRKWQIRFSGAKSQSIDVFLARLEDCRTSANLSEEEVLSALSELFTDTAATWYRNHRDKWTTWQDFVTAARRWYGTSRRYQQRLVAEANSRTQGADEPVRDYLTCLTAIMSKISPPPSLEQQLDQLHRNLRPQLQAMVRRADFRSVEELLELAVDAEQTIECSRTFQPPPPPTAALLPEMAYKPSARTLDSRKSREHKEEKVAAAATENSSKQESLEELFRRVLKQSLAEVGSAKGNTSGRTSPSNSLKGRGYRPPNRFGPKKPPEKPNGPATGPKTATQHQQRRRIITRLGSGHR